MATFDLPDAQARTPPDPAYLRALMAATGQTQGWVARRLGYTRFHVSRWLNGRSPIPYCALYCLEALATAAENWSERQADAMQGYFDR